MLPVGSSPRAWGSPGKEKLGDSTSRFIPTRVGKSGGRCQAAGYSSVHPHARGEVEAGVNQYLRGCDSSPRAWGSPNATTILQAAYRFIPTRVGKSRSHETLRMGNAVHPHARGEVPVLGFDPSQGAGSSPRAWGSLTDDISKFPDIGSSPRAWGSRDELPLRVHRSRFIPTRVGKSHLRAR